ncbi:MAG: amidase [bacterium]
MRHDEIVSLSATAQRHLIARREISPIELIAACLRRIEQLNPTLNAIVTLSEHALEDARALEQRLARGENPGLLCGLPVGIKDVTPVGGLRTTFGSPLYADYIPEEDAEVVRRLRQAGAIILGKTNCPEFAAGGNTFNAVFGRTRNPWNTGRSAGGSTGGGAVGLATGMISLAEGTDLGGSLRIPASFCGMVGLRPSPGLVPTIPSDYLWDNLQVTGPMARRAEDVALMLQAIAGPSERWPSAQPNAGRDFIAAVAKGLAKKTRIAYNSDLAGIGVDTQLEGICRRAVWELSREGVIVDEIDLNLSSGRKAFLALRGYWMVAHHYSRLDRLDQLGENVAGNIRAGLKVTVAELAAAEEARGKIRSALINLFKTYDYLLTPCMAVPPFPVEQNYPQTIAGKAMNNYIDWIAPTFVLSLTGLPVATVPCGLDQQGLPVGLQIVGKPFGEEAVLALAKVIQEAHPIGLPEVAADSFNLNDSRG